MRSIAAIALVTISLACVAVRAAGVQATVRQAAVSSDAPATVSPRAAIDQYCTSCHNARLASGELRLDMLDLSTPGTHAEVWEKVVRKLQTRTMPPAGARRPDEATYRGLIDSLTTTLDRAAAAHPNPGRPMLRRLNRSEYANAIRDLLALEVDASALLPADDSAYG